MQRRTAGGLGPLAEDGYLVLHDVTLPGWLGSLEHLAVGPTGVWVVGSGQGRGRLPGGAGAPAGMLRGLRCEAEVIAELLDGWASVPVRSLPCVHGRWSGGPRSFQGSQLVPLRQLAQGRPLRVPGGP